MEANHGCIMECKANQRACYTYCRLLRGMRAASCPFILLYSLPAYSISSHSSSQFWSFLYVIPGSRVSARSTVFTVKNLCSYTIWPGTLTGNNGAVLGGGGFSLAPGASNQFPAPAGWSGRFWARTGCKFDGLGNGTCSTGDCGGKLNCSGNGGAPPVTLAEFTIGSNSNHFMDFYDVSLVDGYNAGMGIQPSGGTGNCKYAGCVADLNAKCPPELEVTSAGSTVACKSACAAFNTPEYCCTGDHSTPATCPPTEYSKLFKQACPDAYSYAYDDETSTFTCSGADYTITFCPTGM